MSYTYELPDSKAFYDAIKIVALSIPQPQTMKNKLQRFFDAGRCEVINTGKYSGKRWDALGLNINIFIPIDRYLEFSNDVLLKNIISRACEQVLPASIGFDILDVSISPQLNTIEPPCAIDEIEKDVTDKRFLDLNYDLIKKGKQMAKAYITLYALENHLREFIHNILTEKIGVDYSEAISPKLRKSIEKLKEKERNKKWLPLRGDNELYYLDFNELSDLIIFNWEHFQDIIPDQQWINVKIDEMYNIRCLIAHNSYISDENFVLLDITTKQILKQINQQTSLS